MKSTFFTPTVFWPYFTFLAMTALAVVSLWRDRGSTGVATLGRIFYAIPMAVFGAEHLSNARGIMRLVPHWMPGRLFWTYFVGVALIAATISMLVRIQLRLSATLLGLMLIIFVATIHIPGIVAEPSNRIFLVVAVRDTAFGCAALVLAATDHAKRGNAAAQLRIRFLCVVIASSAVFFGVEQFLHPDALPAIPLVKTIPPWIPGGKAWGYLTALALVGGGGAMLINQRARQAAVSLGMLVAALVALIYLPVMVANPNLEGINYFTDTLVYAGAFLIVADALPAST